MRTTLFGFFALLASLSPTLPAATLLDEPFDKPTELTFSYPSGPNEMSNYHGSFFGWTRGGNISVTYGSGLGTNGGGGMLCTVDKPATEFMQLTYQHVALPFSDPTYLTREQFKTYQLEFDANIPEGKRLSVYLSPNGPKDMNSRIWGSRLILGTITGTGAYTRYVMPASAATEQSVTSFYKFIVDAFLNGTDKMEISIIWLFTTREQTWSPGESFQLDNIKLVTAP